MMARNFGTCNLNVFEEGQIKEHWFRSFKHEVSFQLSFVLAAFIKTSMLIFGSNMEIFAVAIFQDCSYFLNLTYSSGIS